MRPVLYPFQQHPAEDEIELYSLGRLGLADEERIEIHLLTCNICGDKLKFLDDFKAILRVAAERSNQL